MLFPRVDRQYDTDGVTLSNSGHHVLPTLEVAARSNGLHGGHNSTSILVDGTVTRTPTGSQETYGVSGVPRVSHCDIFLSCITCDKFCIQRWNIEVPFFPVQSDEVSLHGRQHTGLGVHLDDLRVAGTRSTHVAVCFIILL